MEACSRKISLGMEASPQMCPKNQWSKDHSFVDKSTLDVIRLKNVEGNTGSTVLTNPQLIRLMFLDAGLKSDQMSAVSNTKNENNELGNE